MSKTNWQMKARVAKSVPRFSSACAFLFFCFSFVCIHTLTSVYQSVWTASEKREEKKNGNEIEKRERESEKERSSLIKTVLPSVNRPVFGWGLGQLARFVVVCGQSHLVDHRAKLKWKQRPIPLEALLAVQDLQPDFNTIHLSTRPFIEF